VERAGVDFAGMPDDGDWEDLGSGVFVRRYRFFNQDIGLVIGTDAALVIDTRSSHVQGREIQRDVRRLTRAPWVVLNTHHHFDHTFGNAVFRPAEIWGHERCVAAMRRWSQRAKDEVSTEMPDMAEELAEVEIVPPTRTFDLDATIDLGDRSVEVHHLGRGHTDNDVVAIVPEAGVVFAGDLVEEGSAPYFGDAFPVDWPGTDARLLDLATGPVVPGHGVVVDASFVRSQLEEIAAGVDAARRAHAEGRTVEEAVAEIPYPEPVATDLVRRAFEQLD
jgi:glyoxylase-like metal-dependent hydrolase (beta-lactamase superfamily II)